MDKRILTVQDISCVGQCSLTVALPVLSACGVEAAVLPSAVLSTHTGGGFAGYTFRDLTADMPAIAQHWQKEGFRFDAVYTGYLGSGEQITHVRHIMDTLLVPGGARIVDPAMADNGMLYAGFDAAFVEKMKTLAFFRISRRRRCSPAWSTAKNMTRRILKSSPPRCMKRASARSCSPA